eukprot:SAG22_NODE_1147_length_5370_cov_3.083855_4_plen_139_part_00
MSCKALPLPCVSTAFLSKTLPFHAVCLCTTQGALGALLLPGRPVRAAVLMLYCRPAAAAAAASPIAMYRPALYLASPIAIYPRCCLSLELAGTALFAYCLLVQLLNADEHLPSVTRRYLEGFSELVEQAAVRTKLYYM